MKALALLCLVLLISGCATTGQTTRPRYPPLNITFTNTTQPAPTPANTTPNVTIPPKPPEPGEEDPCDGVLCEDTMTQCPDGYTAFCYNFCHGNGTCSHCTPDCSGHDLPVPPPPPEPPADPEPDQYDVRITAIQYDAPGDDRKRENWNGEWVGISNPGSAPADMGGWTLSDASGHVFVFPGFVLETGASVKVHSGDGEDNATDLFWNSGRRPIWNNDGDNATLKNAASETVSTYAY